MTQSSHSSVYFQIFRTLSPAALRSCLHSASVRSLAARHVSIAISSWVALHGAPLSDRTISSIRMTESFVTVSLLWLAPCYGSMPVSQGWCTYWHSSHCPESPRTCDQASHGGRFAGNMLVRLFSSQNSQCSMRGCCSKQRSELSCLPLTGCGVKKSYAMTSTFLNPGRG